MEKVWLILDGRAWDDPDKASVYCAYSSEKEPPDEETNYEGFSGYTLDMVKKERDEDWPDGVIFEYESVTRKDGKPWLENQTLIG
jgi:hypothetical protein